MIVAFGLSDVGCVRELNEDRILLDPANGLFVAADGMGGMKSGDKAAEIAVQTVKNYFQTTWPFGYDANLPLSQNLVSTAIRLANRRVWRESEASPEYTGMGSTLILAYIKANKATIGSVGDSRIYLHRSKELTQLTKDDSLVARLIESGAISVAEAALHPMRSVLTEAVGAKEAISVETHDLDLLHGDRLMLTSDGAHGVIDEDSLRELLNRGADLKTTVESIIAGARERGGPDNVSCIIVEYRDKEHGA
jgi:serine/threonine protein phosphatase PrpC